MFYLQNKHSLLFSFLIFLSLFIMHSSPIYAVAQAKKQQTLDIKAQYLLLDEKEGISIYKGDVLLTKETLIIKADTITLYYDGEKLTKAVILGSPADVHHEPDNESKVHSQANEMEYFVNEDRLTLKGQAFVDQGDRHFSGEYMEYDTHQRTITAAVNKNAIVNKDNSTANPTKPTGRVHVIIGPVEDVDDVEDVKNGKDVKNIEDSNKVENN